MNALLALFLIFLIFGIGDLVASKTKAFVSMMLVGSIVFMVAFWCGLPATIFTDSGLSAFASITISMFLVNIGTSIKISDFIREWKTVVVVLISTLAIAAGVYYIGSLFIDRFYALVGAPVLAGGMVAYLIMAPVGEAVGRSDLAVFAVLVLVFQSFVGIPIASYFCKKEGGRVLEGFRDGTLKDIGPAAETRKSPITLPDWLTTPNFTLCRVALVGYVSSLLGALTGVSTLIFALIFGVLLRALGLLEENPLYKSNAFTFVLAGATVSIFAGLVNTTPQMVLSMIAPLLLVLLIGLICCTVAAVLMSKVVKFSWQLSIGLAVTAFFGFPGTYLISTEVANATGTTPEEHKAVLDSIMPKMVIAGIVSVSIVSGIIAGFMAKWI